MCRNCRTLASFALNGFVPLSLSLLGESALSRIVALMEGQSVVLLDAVQLAVAPRPGAFESFDG